MWLTTPWAHVEQIIAHPVVNVGVVEGMMVNHDHFIIVLCGDREPYAVPVHLVGPKVTKGTVGIDGGHGSEESLIAGLILERDHEQLIVAVRIGEFDAAIHLELERRRQHRHPRLDLDSLVGLIRAPLPELAVADDIDPHLIHFHLLYVRAFGRHIHGEPSHNVLRGRGLMVKRDDGHEILTLAEFYAISVRKPGLRHLQPRTREKQWFAITGHAGFVVVQHKNVMEVTSGAAAVSREHLGLIPDHVRVVRQLEHLLGHAGRQVAIVPRRQIDRAEREGDHVIVDSNCRVARTRHLGMT